MSETTDKPQPPIPVQGRSSGWLRLRNYFLTGLVIAAPLFLTVYITRTFVEWIDGLVVPLIPSAYRFDQRLPFAVPGFGVVVALIFITLLGFITAGFIGSRLIQYGEALLGRMPIIRNLYGGLKQVFETVLSRQGSGAFKYVAVIEYPRPGLWSIVLVANDVRSGIADIVTSGSGDETVAVFLPTAPNPTNGFLIFVKKSEVIPIDLTVEDALKMVISAGLLSPDMLAERSAKDKTLKGARRVKRYTTAPPAA
jgi:uncharacterized membrane protein